MRYPINELRLAVTTLVAAMVDNPEAVKIDVADVPGGKCFNITSDPRDMGMLIGANGRSARAMRILLNAAARKYGTSITVNIDG